MRWSIAFTAVVVTTLASVACTRPPDTTEIEAVEQQRLDAARAGQPQAAFNADDYFDIIPPGTTRTNRDLQQGTVRPTGYQAPELTFRRHGDVAIVTGTIGGPTQGRDRVLRVWVKRGDTWKAVAFHGTWVGDRAGEARPPLELVAPASSLFQPKDDAERAVWEAHRAVEQASATSNAARYRELTMPEFTRVVVSGEARTLDEWVGGFSGTARQEPVQSNVRIRIYGDVAVMTYMNFASAPDGTPRAPEWMTRLFLRQGVAWKLLHTQSTIARRPQPTGPAGFLQARDAMNAAVSAGDKGGYAPFLADDFTWVDRAGRLRDKATIVAELSPGSASRDNAPDLRSYGDNTVLLIGRRPGAGAGDDVRYLQVWIREGSQWKMLAHHGAPIGEAPVPPATAPSSSAPKSAGPAADVQAVERTSAAINTANRAAKSATFASLTTDQFVAITPSGALESKADRIRQIDLSTPNPQPPAPSIESGTRVHGDVAVTTLVRPADAPQGPRERWTVVTVKQGDTWRRAAIARTVVR